MSNRAADPSPQASPEPRFAPFVDPPHADLLTADDWMHLHVDYDVQGPDRGYIGYIRKDNGQLLSIEDVVQLYGDYVERFVRESRVTAPVGDPMTMQDLYEAYLLGCEDECIPEPKTIEQFAQMLIPQYGAALASPPQIAQPEVRISALELAIATFKERRGKHEGDHDSAHTACSKCELAYIEAEQELDKAVER